MDRVKRYERLLERAKIEARLDSEGKTCEEWYEILSQDLGVLGDVGDEVEEELFR